MSQVLDWLGPEGCFAKRHPRYEFREGQVAMARAVIDALEHEQILLCEAGTGTGKTLAYLLPAIQSGRKVVVSTATRALQDQILVADLPLIQRTLGLTVDAAVMKGLSNYLCRRRLAQESSRHDLTTETRRRLRLIQDFAEHSQSGDKSELVELPEDDPLWERVTSSSDTRLGASCPYHAECFVTRMRERAAQASLVIVNHHLFFADLALRGPHPGRVLPDYDALILDEAHQLESIAVEFFGARVSQRRISRLLGELESVMEALRSHLPEAVASTATLGARVTGAASGLFAALLADGTGEDGRREVGRDDLRGGLLAHWLALDAELEALAAHVELVTSKQGELRSSLGTLPRPTAVFDLEVMERRLTELRETLSVIFESGPDRVVWVEQGERNVTLSSSPIDASPTLRAKLFSRMRAVVLTSATLTTAPARGHLSEAVPSFEYLRARLGLTELESPVVELLVASPFDYQKCSLLYTPRDLPAPSESQFLERAAERIAELVRLTDGGAFVLTTSIRSMKLLAAALRVRLPAFPRLMQGDAPKGELLARFRDDPRSVLVATVSFWEGVDVPGHALRLVILEKIPFSVPTDPLVRARALAIEEAGGNPFVEYFLPAAAIALKQGFGRLIRTRDDTGIVALLDERVHRRGYGQRLLASLPPARRTDSFEAVTRFWRGCVASMPPVDQSPDQRGEGSHGDQPEAPDQGV